MTLCFNFLNKIQNIILAIVIIIGVVVCISIMARHKESRKLMGYILGSILIGIGILSSISLIGELTKTSYINGSINIENLYSQENFKYVNSNIVFYEGGESEEYIFQIENLKVVDFNGLEKKYEVVLNNYELLNCEFAPGAIYCDLDMEFWDTDGTLSCSANLDITIEYLSDCTRLTLETEGVENATYLQSYFTDYGFNLQVTEIL